MASKTRLERAMKQLEDAAEQEFVQGSGVLREGDRIIIPLEMDPRDASNAIMAYYEKMEEDAQSYAEFDAHPNDAMYALVMTIKENFGTLLGAELETWFGKIPGQSVSISVSATETINVPVGYAEIPGVPIKLNINPNYNEKDPVGGNLTVVFEFKRKFEPLVKRIEARVRERLRKSSIFKGKAIDSKFTFLDLSTFDESRVVYGRKEERMIRANILTPIINTDAWVRNGNSLKRGVLMYGPYGTGKTLTARYVASVCERHGWTFVNVIPGDTIVTALKFAKRYQPSVVFFEDIDNDTSGPRDGSVNEVLNTIDGILSKDAKVMVVMTTNHPERINRGMLRPGRLDAMIEMGVLDPESIERLIRVSAEDTLGNSAISGELDSDLLFNTADGYAPAFVVEAVTKAKAYAMSSQATGEFLSIVQQDILDAMDELRPQWEMMMDHQVVDMPEVDRAISDIIDERLKGITKDLKALKEYLL